MMHRIALFLVALAGTTGLPAVAQTPTRSDILVTRLGTVFPDAVQLERSLRSEELYYMRVNGNIYRLIENEQGWESDLLYTTDSHGLNAPQGMAIGPDDTIYLVGNEADDLVTTAWIKRGVRVDPSNPQNHARTWSTLARTEPYPLTGDGFNHLFNGVVVSPDGAYVFVNSGARSDHGEVHENAGNFPGLRDIPLTTVIFRLPADSTDLLLPNDSTALAPYVFARGIRNTFSMAFGPTGDLFGTENSGDRNDPEELNWIREGHHYGFPWRMGDNETPQQFPGFDPDQDPLINPTSTAYLRGFFYDDPSFPTPPAGVTFTDPIPNRGPDADRYMDPLNGEIIDASEAGESIHSFTAHRSPLGLVFNRSDRIIVDAGQVIAEEFREDAFVLSWNDPTTNLLAPMEDDGEDLLHIDLEKIGDAYVMHATQLVTGFDHPIDAVFDPLETTLYVIENGASRGLWEVQLPVMSVDIEPEVPQPDYALSVYPSPASGSSTIAYTLPADGAVRIALFDLLGRRLDVLVDARQAAGPHEVRMDWSDRPAGLYFVRMETAGRAVIQAVAHR
ncbi:MAG: PQQ-dependent sugar dehydrogenase [Rhodothermales bacterium]